LSENDNGSQVEVVLAAAVGDFEGFLDQRGLELLLHTRIAPETVALDGARVPSLSGADAYANATQGWFFDPDDRFGVIHIKAGSIDTRQSHTLTVSIDPQAEPAATDDYPAMPDGDGTIGQDDLMVVSRPAEEPGHPLENAFDQNLDTWFRTVRDQSIAYGPHEFVLSLGGRRVVEGFTISPRNDKYWKYGQVRDYEVYLADVSGLWGDPVATGSLEQTEEQQEVRFTPRAGRLLRFRVLNTHDDGADPMVLGATDLGGKAYDALAPVQVGPTTISEFRLLETAAPAERSQTVSLAEKSDASSSSLRMNGLDFASGLRVLGDSRIDFELTGNWHTFVTEAGVDDAWSEEGSVRFQVWGNDRLLWDSGTVTPMTIVKPKLDIRGLSTLSLRTIASDPDLVADWAEVMVNGFVGDTVDSR